MTAPEFVQRLEHVIKTANGYTARCPAHEDHNNSLSVGDGQDGRVLVKCFAECTPEAIVEAMGLDMSDLFADSARRGNGTGKPMGKIVATYDFVDESGKVLYQEVRFEPKDFKLRRPDGKGGWVWHLECDAKCKCKTKLPPVRRVLYNLPALLKATFVLVVEGPKDCETARNLGFVATTNASGANAPWLPEYSESLRHKPLCLIADADAPGVAHTRDAARSLVGVAQCVKLIETLPGVPYKGDLSDYVQVGGMRESLLKLIDEAPELTAADVAKWKAEAATAGPWADIESMHTFLSGEDTEAQFLDPEKHFLARECVTEIFAPRGLGKTFFALWMAIRLAARGLRVLYLDRDNSPFILKSRLRGFGATSETSNLKAISRDKCPPLADKVAWAKFPYADFDVVFVDSMDAVTEGVGEQDSAKPSRALAPLLDVVRRTNGPAVMVLGNTTRDAKHSRGSGVIEDRADIVYETRDATEIQLTGKKVWFEELPPAGADFWASRASRRKQREKYRLAFVNSKFRVGPEPEPFVMEIDTTTDPWSVRDVTDEIDREGAEARHRKAAEKAETIQKAVDALTTEIQRRSQAGKPAILKKQAEEFLTHVAELTVTQKMAREVINSKTFKLVDGEGKGHPKAVQLAGKKEESNRNNGVADGVKTLGVNDSDFGGPLSMHSTEIDPTQTRENYGSEKPPISVEGSLFTPPAKPENGLADDPAIQTPPSGENSLGKVKEVEL